MSIRLVSKRKSIKTDRKIIWPGDYLYYTNFFLDFIIDKYKNVCPIKNTLLGYNTNTNEFTLQTNNKKVNNYNEIIEVLQRNFDNCSKQFIVLMVALEYLNPLTNKNYKHRIALIYDQKYNVVELFDPEGSGVHYQNFGIMNDLKKLFNKVLETKVKYYNTIKFNINTIPFQHQEVLSCNNFDFNINTNIGFCVIWCMYYIEVRLKNPDHDIEVIRKELLREFNKDITFNGKEIKSVCKIIREYTLFIMELANEKELKQINFTIQSESVKSLLDDFLGSSKKVKK